MNKYYADLVRALNNAAIVTSTDLEGRITFVNEKFCEISGYSQQELLGKTHSIVKSKVHSKEFFEQLWNTITRGRVWYGEICNRKKTGELYWVQATILPLFDKDSGEIYKYDAIRFDITEMKKRELAEQKKASLYQAVIDSPDGFARIDIHGSFLGVSDAYCQLTGYSREELLTMNVRDLDIVDDEGYNSARIQYIIKKGYGVFESKRRCKDSSICTVQVTATYSPVDGGIIFLFLHDISRQKMAEKHNEELRKQLNHMQKIDSIGRLTAGISHDFNNILSGILGYAELSKSIVAEDIKDRDVKDDLMRNLNQIEIAGKRAAGLIAQMMTYCRQDPPTKNIEIKPTQSVIREVVTMVRVGLTEKFKIELDLNDTPDIPMDSSELHQVLTNLLVNARDSMKTFGCGIIKLKLSMVEISNCQCTACLMPLEGTFIELSVSDCGSGMDNETMSSIFDPFFTTKGVGEGTGLGLSTVSGLVHSDNGHILVNSKVGQGTTFALLFPNVTLNL